MIVVADTSPLNYLIQIECGDCLPRLYGCLLIPIGVLKEMEREGAPAAVRRWIAELPAWVGVAVVESAPDQGLAFLGLGEREAIQLAQERQAELLLIDERKGRLEAKRRGLRTTGTLGVLLAAGELGILEPEPAYRRLVAETTFRTSTGLEALFLAQVKPSKRNRQGCG